LTAAQARAAADGSVAGVGLSARAVEGGRAAGRGEGNHFARAAILDYRRAAATAVTDGQHGSAGGTAGNDSARAAPPKIRDVLAEAAQFHFVHPDIDFPISFVDIQTTINCFPIKIEFLNFRHGS